MTRSGALAAILASLLTACGGSAAGGPHASITAQPRPLPPPPPPPHDGEDPFARCERAFAGPPPFVASAGDADDVDQSSVDADDWDQDRFFGAGHAAVPGRIVGVLFERGFPVVPPAEEPAGYAFSARAEQAEPVLFLDPSTESRMAVGAFGSSDGAANVQGLRPGAPNRWGLHAEAHLAELEINYGHGRPGLPQGSFGSLFVTCVRRLDDALTVPLPEAMRTAYSRFVATHPPRANVLRRILLEPTWLTDEGVLEVAVLLRETDQQEGLGCAPCIADSPSCPCAFRGTVTGARYRFHGTSIARETSFEARPMAVSVVDGVAQ